MVQLQERLKDLQALGYQLIAISPDNPETNGKTMKKHGLDIPIYSDAGLETAQNFGITFRVDEATVKLYLKYDIDLVKLYGRNQPLMPVPSLFIMDREGTIRFQYVNPDYRQRPAPELVLAAAKASLPPEKP